MPHHSVADDDECPRHTGASRGFDASVSVRSHRVDPTSPLFRPGYVSLPPQVRTRCE
ncbi:hypothetical protein [Alloactinosynnema sp. L-07]|nr:hypothetical protein [Alloactinosynnema sp. L-07]